MRVSLVLALGLALGCSSVTEVRIGDSVTLAPGEAARVASNDIEVQFTGVSDDSRCPVGDLVQCVWEGDAMVRLRVTGLVGTATPALHTHPDLGRATTYGPYRLELVELTPIPTVAGPPAHGAYRLTLQITSLLD